jgi:hypothetical protein
VEYLHAGPDFHGTHYLDNVDVGGVTFKDAAAGYSLAYLLALINSSVLRWYFPHVAAPLRVGAWSANKQYLSLMPFLPLDLKNPAERAQHDAVVKLIDHLVWLKTQPSVIESSRDNPIDPDIAAYIEQWVNALVYELYFPAEICAAGLQFFELTESLKLPALDSLPAAADRLERFRKLHKEWSGQGHGLHIALDKLRTLDLVRTIEGQT